MSKAGSIGKAVATLAVIGGVGFGGWYFYKNYASPEANSTDKVYVQKVANVNTVTGADLFANSFSGVIVAQKSVDVRYDSTKTIEELLVADGDKVQKGDKLLTYDTEAIQLEIDTAKLEVERLENDVATNEQQIKQYEEEKKKASADAAVSYTNQILQLQSDNARAEYDIKAKNVEISKLEASIKNAYVVAPIDGTVSDLKEPGSSASYDDYYGYGYGDSADVIMKLSADGDYRVKGVFNEQNSGSIYQGAEVILRSRIDDSTVKGTVSEIDTSPQTDNNNMYGFYDDDEQSSSSKYAFYVEPESLDGFMLGQHILIDTDNGSDIEKTGIWLYTDFVIKEDGKAYVWAKNEDKDVIEKRYVKIGQEDESYGDCEILEGLTLDDYIAYPADYIRAGLGTTTNISDKDIPDNDLGEGDMGMGDDFYDDGYYEDDWDGDWDGGWDDNLMMNEDGSYSLTDENGNFIEVAADGSMVMTSPDGGVIETDSNGEFIRGGFDEETGEYIFDYGDGEPSEIADDDGNGEDNGDAVEPAEPEVPDLTFEEMYGISESEWNSMSAEEQEAFLKQLYN